MTSRAHIYQRNTSTTGRVVDTGPPRTHTGDTGLGAVGGPTGVGAGALRVLIEFITEYDAKELRRLESDLAKLQAQEGRQQKRLLDARRQEANQLGVITRAENLRNRFNLAATSAQKRELTAIRDLERTRGAAAKAEAATRKAALVQATGFRKAEISSLINEDRIKARAEERRAIWASRVAAQEEKITKNQSQQVATQQRIGTLQQIKAQVGPRLGALGIGAIGGVFGGAVVGLGFAAAQALIDGIGQALSNLLDPAKKAREALEGVAEAVNKLAEKEGLSLLEAANQVLDEFGEAAAGIPASTLAAAAALQQYIDKNEKLAAILEVVRHQEELAADEVRKRANEIAKQRGVFGGTFETFSLEMSRGAPGSAQAVAGQNAALFTEIYNQALRELANTSVTAANAQSILAAEENAAANAAALASIRQEQLANSLSRISSRRIGNLQDQMSALGDSGPSARTQQLQGALEGLAEAQAQYAYGSQLAAIAEERALILLERRIRFQGESVRLDGLSARAQLVAIDARIKRLQDEAELEQEALDRLDERIEKLRREDQEQDQRDQERLDAFDERIEALQKAGDAQERLNRLLDIQYRLSQTIRRQQGESIGDFLSRRANETRQLLAEEQAARRDQAIGAIQARRDEIEAIIETRNARREEAIEALELERQRLADKLEKLRKIREAEIRELNKRRDRLELEVRLQELAEREKQLAVQESFRRQQAGLQAALRASQEADRRAVESKRAALQRMIEAEQRRFEKTRYWINQENIERAQAAIRSATTLGDINVLAGQIAGAQRVLGELRALVAAGVIPASYANERIASLVALIREYTVLLQTNANYNRGEDFTPSAKGGVFFLSNAMNNPFGANIRTGEEGQEIGVVLSNRVARILQEQSMPKTPSFGALVINRSTDPWQDAERARRLARQTVEDMLR